MYITEETPAERIFMVTLTQQELNAIANELDGLSDAADGHMRVKYPMAFHLLAKLAVGRSA